MTSPALRRVVRRETHSPRTVAMAVAVVVLLAAVVYAGIEIALPLFGQPALLVAPEDAAAWLVSLPTLEPVGGIVAGAAAFGILGLVLIVLALAPGRLAKHRMDDGERAVVVDNGVIASAVAQHVSDETGIPRASVTVGVAHRSADVTVRLEEGDSLEKSEVQRLVDTELDSYRLVPPVRGRVRLVVPRESRQDS